MIEIKQLPLDIILSIDRCFISNEHLINPEQLPAEDIFKKMDIYIDVLSSSLTSSLDTSSDRSSRLRLVADATIIKNDMSLYR